jgi:hypothetical protein
MRSRLHALIVLASALAVAPAAAQSPPPSAAINDAARAVAGGWEFSNAARDKLCMVTLRAEGVTGGLKIEFDRACAAIFPFVREVTAWTVAENEFLRLVDARGRPVLEFSEVEGGLYEAPRPGEGILFLQTAAAVGPAPRSADQMIGDWAIMRAGGKPMCVVTLSDTAAGADIFALRVKPGCDRLVTQFGPTTWRMDRGELLLVSPRGSWRFESDDPTTWHRIPETTEPLLLVKQ